MRRYVYISLLLFTFFAACKKEADEEPYATDPEEKVNRWVLDSMRRYYYWADELSANYTFSQTTETFFKNLLSANDRFSWISNGEDVAPPSNSYFMYGFHYVLVEVAGYDRLIGVVTLTNKGGAADQAGLQRGSYFSQVNGADITAANMETVNRELKTGTSLTLTPVQLSTNTWTALPAITLHPGFAAENPVHYTRSFTAGNVTTGYMFYNSFDENYDGQLLQAIAKLKQANVSELVLDLRYNAGGSVASSAKLAAMLTGSLTGNETYAVYQGNRHEGRRPRSLQAVLNTSTNDAGKQYATLQANRLMLQRVFILTTGATVSAAELIINNLKPFMTVVQIGATTAGKDEASFLIEDFRVPKQVEWKMQPTIYKLFNKNNQGGYSTGIVPQYVVEELAAVPLVAIGETNDPLVEKALQLIYGNNLPGGYSVLRKGKDILPIKTIYRSADAANNLIRGSLLPKP